MQFVERTTHPSSQEQLTTHGINPILAKLWASRGVESIEAANLELKLLTMTATVQLHALWESLDWRSWVNLLV